MKRIKYIFLSACVLAALLGGPTALSVSAQDGQPPVPLHTPVFHSYGAQEEIQPSAESFTAFPESYVGTGIPEEGAETTARIPREFTLFESQPLPESVIGADNRTQITNTTAYPNRAIALLDVEFFDGAGYVYGTCTGWFIGPRTVVTAGHCVYDGVYGWSTYVWIYPGYDGVTAPYGYTTGYNAFTTSGWVNTGSPAGDYAAIQTNGPKGNTVGWFAYKTATTYTVNHTVRGYPGDKPDGTMWSMAGKITNKSANRLWYQMDTFGGQSGSPVYRCPAIGDTTGGCTGYGIHNYGASISPYSGNSATRVTSGVITNLNNWKNAPYP